MDSPLVDAAVGFLRVLRDLSGPAPAEILATWEGFYSQRFPELHAKQIQDCTEAGEDWRTIALARVFAQLPTRLAALEEARGRILGLWDDVLARARAALGLELDVVAVVHVGIGCGAGWATTYEGKSAVLFGLENIAELDWYTTARLEGLIAHELGHVAHAAWRGEPVELVEEDPLGLLYSEGFAQRLEGVILGRESWHLAPDEGWLPWCREHLPELARAFRNRAAQGKAVNAFFGSWLSYRGVPFTGHFLGHTVIRMMEEGRTLPELAGLPLPEVRASVDGFLRALGPQGSSL
ncbi:hypothetical protein H5T54_00020 [Candidatus Bipolaricaulota bacterium]|nr:hypothetical protein [Candidatus Bipolaricaulota bacterium]